MDDTSAFEARFYQERMATEYARQEAANLEIEYWKLRMKKEGLASSPVPSLAYIPRSCMMDGSDCGHGGCPRAEVRG